MNNTLKRVFSLIVALIYMFSLSACNADSRAAVVKAAKNFTESLKVGDVETYAKMLDKNSDNYDEHVDFITEWFDDSDLENIDEEERNKVKKAVFDTLSFKIDEDSAEAYEQTGEGTVNVLVEYVDFKDLTERKWNTGSVDVFLKALANCKRMVKQTLSLDFVLERNNWVVADFSSVENLLHSLEFNFHFGKDYEAGIDYLEWWYSISEGTHIYCDTDIITLCAKLNDIGQGFFWQYYYTVEYKNKEIYKSSVRTYADTDYIDAFLFCSYEGCPCNDSGCYFAPGKYKFSFYDINDNVFAVDTCSVTISASSDIEGGDEAVERFDGNPVGMDLLKKYTEDTEDTEDTEGKEDFEFVEIKGNDGCTIFYDSDFYEQIKEYCWWDYATSTACHEYNTETEYMAYSLMVDESSFMTVYYEYYNIETGELVFAKSVSPTVYEDGTYYDIDFEVETGLVQGSYMLIVMDNSHKKILLTSTVEAVE